MCGVVKHKSFVFGEVVGDASEVVDGRIELIGPEINDVLKGQLSPYADMARCRAPSSTRSHTEFAMRGMVLGWFFLEGCRWVVGLDSPWLRISKKVAFLH